MRQRWWLMTPKWGMLGVLMVVVAYPFAWASDDPKLAGQTTFAFGWGGERVPRWLGAGGAKSQGIPFFDLNWHDRVELSSTDGLSVDLIHSDAWHGGLLGTMMWGRSTRDLAELSRAVPTLNNTHQAGLYLENEVVRGVFLGLSMRHDIQDTGAAYANVYANWDLPSIFHIEQSVKIDSMFMNGAAMRRNFGLSAESAAELGVQSYRPAPGHESDTLSYQVFLPLGQSIGIVAGANWSLLQAQAAESPLVARLGTRMQRTYMAAFMAHF